MVELLYRRTPSTIGLTMSGPAHFYEPRNGHGLPHDGIYDTASVGHVLRGGGPADYFSIGPEQLFHMTRPGDAGRG
jgi:hypothetical protein